ncbi:protein FAM161A [Gouania willdenowi]|uniref:protein FAM161A n=1 Tax=Gouania willdenowi TaxID=441366 RepID=UPI0010544043|nr:protein FAM161A [Gouania willdenowi]
MATAHRTNVLVTSCLKTPVDPNTKAPLASYERETLLPSGCTDNRDYDKELKCEDSGSDFCDEEDCLGNGDPHIMATYRATEDRFNLSEIFFSNEEYYSKLEELKKAHLRTMAELENMYQQKLQLRTMEPLDSNCFDLGNKRLWSNASPAATRRLRKSYSAAELRCAYGQLDSSDNNEAPSNEVEKCFVFSPKEHIKNMWRDFELSPYNHHLSSSLHSLPKEQGRSDLMRKDEKRQPNRDKDGDPWKHRVTIPKPFQMTLRETERKKHGIKTRSEIGQENTELRRQLEELRECQKKFRASPVPAHVHLPLYEEQKERNEQRRRSVREREEQHLRSIQRPFSFLERERQRKEQKQHCHTELFNKDKIKPFKAKPVPKSVYAAASEDRMKEEQLYRSIKIQMRAQEMLHSASMPPSMLARRLSERKKNKEDRNAAGEDGSCSHRPQITKEVPDFDARYRRFQKHLKKQKEVRPTTACEPFELRTSQIHSHRERILADKGKEQTSPQLLRWPYIGPPIARTPNSSLCSSLSGSLELLPAKDTDATRKRHEAVRKVLQQRKKAEEVEEQLKERQKQREKKLQSVVLKRAQANDPHVALSLTNQSKLKEFRKQDIQRKKEYKQEIKQMHERVKGRLLLLEQVAQCNAKRAAEKHYTKTLQELDVPEDFICSKAAKASPSSKDCNQEEADAGYESVLYRKVYIDDEEWEDPDDREDRREEDGEQASLSQQDIGNVSGCCSHKDQRDVDHCSSEDSYHYSDDHED